MQWRTLASCAVIFLRLAASGAELNLTTNDRVLVLAPHPDDEVVGCGGVIQRALHTGAAVRVAFLTYGDNNEWSFMIYRMHPVLLPEAVLDMGRVRHDEALEAAGRLGLSKTNLVFLGYPDFGTLAIWQSHWGDRPPYRSGLTHAESVPYDTALRPGAPYKAGAILHDLESLIADFRPTKIFVSHPADYNGDHLALYLFTRIALWDMKFRAPLFPYLVHYGQWPQPRGLLTDAPLNPPDTLTNEIAWTSFPLDDAERAAKKSALEAHRSQVEYSSTYLHSFVRANELFGDFPSIILRSGTNADSRALSELNTAPKPVELLTDEERAAYVGFEERTVCLDQDRLELTLRFSRPLAETVQATVNVFGYRRGRSFTKMPKIHIQIGELSESVRDQNKTLPAGSVEIQRHSREILIRIPLSVLGDPDRILTNARTYLGNVPLDSLAWRVLEFPVVKAGKGR